jgi:di/tricarboxylate transporter
MELIHWILIAIVLIPLIAVFTNRLRIDVAALFMATALGVLQLTGFGLLGPAGTPSNAIKAISGFSEPVVITLLSLFILTRGLEQSGATRWLTDFVLRISGKNENRLIILFAALTAVLSLFMNNLAAGALVLPSAMEACRRTGIRPSKLLIPVAYGSLLGGSATYFTTANIIMSNLLTVANPPQNPLRILDFTPTGGLIALAGLLFLGLFGKYLLPNRKPLNDQPEPRHSTDDLEDLYSIGERLWEGRVINSSPLIGKTLEESHIGEKFGVSIAALRRIDGSTQYPSFDLHILNGDILLIVGREEKILLLKELGVDLSHVKETDEITRQGVSYVEIIMAPHSQLEGKTLKDIDFRQKYGLSVIALKRRSRTYRTNVGDVPLEMGDSLLAIGKRSGISSYRSNPDLIFIVPSSENEPVNRHQAIISLILIGGGIVASLGGVPVYLAMLTAAVLSLILHATPIEEIYHSIEWQAIFLIAGMYAVSLAMVQTGLAGLLGETVISLARPFGPLGIAAGAYLLTGILTQFLGGQVASLVTGPITISAAINMGVNPQAVAVATAIGCSATFLTPLAHPVNILMIAPANYRFSDFFRAGWLLTLLSFVMLLIGLKLFWQL